MVKEELDISNGKFGFIIREDRIVLYYKAFISYEPILELTPEQFKCIHDMMPFINVETVNE